MDWDGIGAFALFFSSGAVGLGLIALRAYKAKLASKLDWERLRSTIAGMLGWVGELHHLLIP